MATLLSNLVNNLAEEIHKIVNMHMMIKNLKFAELNTKIASVVLNTQTLQ